MLEWNYKDSNCFYNKMENFESISGKPLKNIFDCFYIKILRDNYTVKFVFAPLEYLQELQN